MQTTGQTPALRPGRRMMMAIAASESASAQTRKAALEALYDFVPVDQADVIVALGGDGFMLETMHENLARGLPVYGMNCGTVGYMLNDFDGAGLEQRIQDAEQVLIHPLRAEITLRDGSKTSETAINEVAVKNEGLQSAKMAIAVGGKTYMESLSGDGAMIATSIGSTAYNLAAGGPALPADSHNLALTPINPFRPRRWRGAVLPGYAVVTLTGQELDKRPLFAAADSQKKITGVEKVEVREDRSRPIHLLFDQGHALQERILREQFAPG